MLTFSAFPDSYLQGFREHFPQKRVIFKQHHLIHYPAVLLRSGPFVQQCVLKYERKHQYFKLLAQVIRNFKNVPKSMTARHQLTQYVNWSEGPPLKSDYHVSCGKSVPAQSFSIDGKIGYCTFHYQWYMHYIFMPRLYVIVFSCLVFIGRLVSDVISVSNNRVFESNSVSLRGVKYSVRDCVMLTPTMSSSDETVPTFRKILNILTGDNDEVVFICHTLTVQSYHHFSKSYLVSEGSSSEFVIPNLLFDFHPLSLHGCFEQTCTFSHVVLRHRLDFNNYAAYKF